jgi:VanZ family protein
MNKTISAMQILWPLLSLAVAILIFYSSSQTGEASDIASMSIVNRVTEISPLFLLDRSTLNLIFRKGAHFAIFFVLAFCLTHSLKYYMKKYRLFFAAWGIAALYGISDEIHQYFVPGRSSEITDMVINACGAFFGAGLVLLWLLYKGRHIVEGNDSSAVLDT